MTLGQERIAKAPKSHNHTVKGKIHKFSYMKIENICLSKHIEKI